MTRSRMDRDVSQYAGLESRGESFPVSPLFAPNVNLLSAPSSIPASYTFQCPFCASHGAPTWNLIGGEVFWDAGPRENYSFDGASFRYLDLFFFLHDLWMRLALKDIFLLLRFLIQIPNIIEAFINAHCIFIILLWIHSRRIAWILWRCTVEKHFENFKHNLYRDKILQQFS